MAFDWTTLLSGITKPFFDTVGGVLDKTITDKNARAEAQEKLLQSQADMQAALLKGIVDNAQGQLEVNKVEAANASIFVAGWRPSVGWICSAALAWQFVVEPILNWALSIAEGIWKFTVPPLPALDAMTLMPVLMGMLGIGTMRTWERIHGCERSSIKGDSIDQP